MYYYCLFLLIIRKKARLCKCVCDEGGCDIVEQITRLKGHVGGRLQYGVIEKAGGVPAT